MNFWEKETEPEIRQVIPMTNGIFSHMNYTFQAGISASNLDSLFLSSYGRRNLAPLIELIAEKYDAPLDEILPETALQELASIVLGMYKIKWDKHGSIPGIDYDPIHNYLHEWEDSEEGSRASSSSEEREGSYTVANTITSNNTRTDDLEETRSTSESNSNTRTDNLSEVVEKDISTSSTRTDNLSEVVDKDISSTSLRTDNLSQLETRNLANSGSGSENNNVFAFDSNTAVGHDTNSNSRTGSDTGTVTTANTGTQNTSVTEATDVTTRNTGTQSTSGTEDSEITTRNTGTQSDSGSKSVSETIENTGTQSDSGREVTNGTTTNESEKSGTFSGTDERERSGVHTGNIGNITTQKMLKEEIDLWRWNYVRSILDDACQLLCCDCYLNY